MTNQWIIRVWIFLIAMVLTSCATKTLKRDRDHYEIAENSFKRTPARPLIVIDAGHGGKDPGAKCLNPKIEEKTLNLQTVLILNQLLQKMGYRTILTRGEDFFVPLKLRADFANSNRASIFVSMHYNSAPNKKATGVEVYYYDSEENKTRTVRSKLLAQKTLDSIVNGTGMKSRGIKKGNFAVIRETQMPAILIEGGFMTNDEELRLLRDPVHMHLIAENIAKGIRDYLRL